MEFIHIDDKPEPMIIYKPYIYKEITDCTKFYIIKQYTNKGIHTSTIYKDDMNNVKNKYYYRRK